MKRFMTMWVAAVSVLAWPGASTAHHSLVRFDTATPVWVKGRVARFDLVNPHVRFYLDETKENGQTQQWIVEGPPSNNIARMRIGPDFLKTGDVIEVCGFTLKEEPNVSSGRVLSGHLLVMPAGKRQYWSDYGVLYKCLNPGEDAETFRRDAFGR